MIHLTGKTLRQLKTLQKQIRRAHAAGCKSSFMGKCDHDVALEKIEAFIKSKTARPFRSALPKKRQRELGLRPQVTAGMRNFDAKAAPLFSTLEIIPP